MVMGNPEAAACNQNKGMMWQAAMVEHSTLTQNHRRSDTRMGLKDTKLFFGQTQIKISKKRKLGLNGRKCCGEDMV